MFNFLQALDSAVVTVWRKLVVGKFKATVVLVPVQVC